jgi:hypothetical protein
MVAKVRFVSSTACVIQCVQKAELSCSRSTFRFSAISSFILHSCFTLSNLCQANNSFEYMCNAINQRTFWCLF